VQELEKLSHVMSKEGKSQSIPTFSIQSGDFETRYLDERQPCVITDLVTLWPAFKNWSIPYFNKHWGDIEVPLSPLEKGQSKPPWPRKVKRKLSSFLKDITQTEDDNMFYVQQVPTNLFPKLDNDFSKPKFMPSSCILAQNTLFIGAAPIRTSLHFDQPCIDNIFCQIVGEKRIRMFSPEQGEYLYPYPESGLVDYIHVSQIPDLDNVDLTRFPKFAKAKGNYDFVLKPGMAVYIPKGWWHHIESVTTPTISLNWWYY